MTNMITTNTTKTAFIVATSYDSRSVKLFKQAGGRWNPEKKWWSINIESLNGNFSLIREIVRYNSLEVKKAAAEFIN